MQLNIRTQTEIFHALADESRLRIIRLLANSMEEACLCELVDSLLEPKYKLSRHLKILRQAGFLLTRKEGRWIYHRLNNDSITIASLGKIVAGLPDLDGRYSKDLEGIKLRIELRKAGCCCEGIQNSALA